MFKLYFRSKALKALAKIEKKTQLEINDALDNIKLGRFENYNIRKIEGTEFGYRLRLGRWRILFALFSKEKRIEIIDIFIKKGRKDYLKRRKLIR